ncbi:MAG: biopolymer transporter ExbD [Calditrichaceae bacterium]|jgi:biopolymer transport protein ExbD
MKPIGKIEITPLVGVALILVIVFMVTSPLMMTPPNIDVNLPKARTVEAKSESNITISFSNDRILALNEKIVPKEQLGIELSKVLKDHPDRLVVIRADKNLTHREVLEVLGIAKKAGATHLAVATLQRNRGKFAPNKIDG